VNDSAYVMNQILRNGVIAAYDNLLVVNATLSDLVGLYSCIVQDSLGRNSEMATFQVNGKILCSNHPLFLMQIF